MSSFKIADYINSLELEFKNNANAKIAIQQENYVHNKFEYFGLITSERRLIQKPFLVKEFLPPKPQLANLTTLLWGKPQREFQYFSQELVFKYVRQFELKDIELLELMVTQRSWWETVDYIAVKLMGAYFKLFPEQREFYCNKWLASNHIWLQRSALLFQLKYKHDIDYTLLSNTINYLLGSKEFFINKAIGWVLREYSRTKPDWVLDFVEKTPLNPLSKREALRLIN